MTVTPIGDAPKERPRLRKTEARQARIADLVLAEGSMGAHELAERFAVSLMTIHRDFDELEKRGVLRKVRGGVTAQPSGVFESRVGFRLTAAVEEKRRIALAALAHVEPGMSLILDDSTTVLNMVAGLAELGPLHVATNFLAGLNQLAEVENVRAIAVGGDYDPLHDSFQGMQAVEAVEGIRADALFMSSSALSATHVYHQEDRVVAVKRAMIAASTKRYLLVDHTKLDRVALHRLAPLADFDLLITDAQADPAALDALRAAGIPVEVAS
jgi:DeoR/GlpR family transcriptional regulator of sugar metabolism